MWHVGAADVEGPGDGLRIGDNQRVGLELGDFAAHALELGGGVLAGIAQVVQGHGPERRGRPVAPDRVDRIGFGRHERRPGGRAGPGEPFGGIDRVQPRIVPKLCARAQVRFDPGFRRRLDQMRDREDIAIDLILHLQSITAIDEDHRAVGQNDGDAGGAGKPGEPRQPFLGGRQVLVLVAVRARHDEAGQSAPGELGAQPLDASCSRGALVDIIERLKLGLEHRRQSMGRMGAGQPRLDAWLRRIVSAADLQFLQRLPQARLGTSNRKAALES
jgi:hypothetical protein